MSVTSQRERLMDLLADRALVGLDPVEEEELARLLVAFPDAEEIARDLELAAAAVAIAGVSKQGMERMPPSLFAKLDALSRDGMPTNVHGVPVPMADAAAAKRSAAVTQTQTQTQIPQRPSETPNVLKQTMPMPGVTSMPTPARPSASPGAVAPLNKTLVQPQAPIAPAPSSGAPAAPVAPSPPAQVIPFRPTVGPHRAPPLPDTTGQGTGRLVMVSGWIAAAACLLFAIGAWYFRPRTEVVRIEVPASPPSANETPPPRPTPTPAQERDALLARAGTARLDWANNAADPASKQASGDVVWNAAEQRGYMRFRGLAKNDKRLSVYQLWIFDKARDDRYPVDGGVFDVDDETGDVIVPIKAKLPVSEVALFAVTVEKPGGVVVSKRERIVVTAKPAS